MYLSRNIIFLNHYYDVYDWSNVFFCFQVWVYGNSFESCLVAVVNPNKRSIESWARENDISEELDSICQNPKTKEYILGELNIIGKEKKVCL